MQGTNGPSPKCPLLGGFTEAMNLMKASTICSKNKKQTKKNRLFAKIIKLNTANNSGTRLCN